MSKKSTLGDAEIKRQLDYARSLKNEDIDTSDPDAHEIRPDQLASGRSFHEVFRPLKTSISLRVDNDVLDYYRQKGEGYQTRMNAALRAQMNAERRRARA